MPSIECGTGNAECGIARKGRSHPQASTDTPHSAFPIPHLLAGAVTLALLPLPARAQQADSIPADTLAPCSVTGVRLPTVRDLAPCLAVRTPTLGAVSLDIRGVTYLPLARPVRATARSSSQGAASGGTISKPAPAIAAACGITMSGRPPSTKPDGARSRGAASARCSARSA